MDQLWQQLNPNNVETPIDTDQAHQYKDNWKEPSLGVSQRVFVNTELEQMKAGNMPDVYNAYVELLKLLPDNVSMIDLACSTGYYKEVADFNVPGKIVYYGSDYNEASVNVAKQLYPDTEFYVEDLTDLGFEDRCFNVAMVAGVLEHITDQEKAFDEFCRIANDYVICHRMKFITGQEYFTKGSQYKVHKVPVVRYYYNREKFIQRLADRGFEMVASIQIYPHTKSCESFLFQRK
jgi:ubiquinone/menaquinone biosynthesis C-methylase UbiE